MRTEPERFDRVLEHPAYKSAPLEPITVPLQEIAEVTPAAIITAGISLLVTLLLVLERPFSSVSQLLLGLLVGVVGWAFYLSVQKARTMRDAPSERIVAVVIKERMDLRRRFGDRRESQRTYVIVQLRDGERREYFAPKQIVGRYAVDDIGIAYVKSDVMVDFLRIDV